MTGQALRFASFLSPALYPTYEHIIAAIARSTGIPAHLEVGEDLNELTQGHLAGGFICGLIYTHLARSFPASIELSAAPLLLSQHPQSGLQQAESSVRPLSHPQPPQVYQGEPNRSGGFALGDRYQRKPYYFSDIVVHRDSPFASLADLAGCTWAYNETASHSGYNLVLYSLLQQGLPPTYFSAWRASGSHARSLALVAQGEADATAIDSHVLSALLRDNPALSEQIRCIGAFGPSAVPPFVVSTRLSPGVRQAIQAALLGMAHEPLSAQQLKHGFIERFVPVSDEHYNDIRHMYTTVQTNRQIVFS